MMANFGVKNPAQIPEVRKKISKGLSRYYLINGCPKQKNFSYQKRHYYRGIRGRYKSRFGMTYIYKSTWELTVMKFLDMHPLVETWLYEPFSVKYTFLGEIHSYTPDFFIDFSGIREVWEVKPENFINGASDLQWTKFYALEEKCNEEKFRYDQTTILTEKEIKGIKEIDWKELYLRYGFSLDDLRKREQEMVEKVKIDDIPYGDGDNKK